MGIYFLNVLIKLQTFRKFRAAEIENFQALLEILDVPHNLHDELINHYLFTNTWQHWKSLHYERPLIFQKYWKLENKEKVKRHYQNQQVIIFLYKHTPLSNQHLSLIRFGLRMKFVGLGNTHSKNFLALNGQEDLPREVMDSPHKYPKLVRNQQLRKIISVLNNTEGYAINYFFDGQEGSSFRYGRIGNLHYRLSTGLLRFLRPHTQLIMVEPLFALDGSVAVQFHEIKRLGNFDEQFDEVQNYYERTLLATLPALNEYMISCLLKNHHAVKNSN
ncbi:hypothetical protein [Dyadobacter sediminis]|uniref:hypothetical protein n=1 Tax=Dyadobacter sediminis TaxID=1493691 RepID=UPI001E2EBF79|nr:hypothetical protein [Dyadobacter sediminis]